MHHTKNLMLVFDSLEKLVSICDQYQTPETY